jgi:hypothetical protein
MQDVKRLYIGVARGVGLEPTTSYLTGNRSTIELSSITIYMVHNFIDTIIHI